MDDLQQKLTEGEKPVVFSGFDGFVDTLVKVISHSDNGKNNYFCTMDEFGEYLKKKRGKSCSLETKKITEQGGGNSILYAKTMAALGCNVCCVGAYGYPEMKEIFKTEDENLNLYSVSDPGYCTALEFNDGKVMLGENQKLNEVCYQTLKDRMGEENLITQMNEAWVLSFMNWSEMPGSTDIWKGIQKYIVPMLKPAREQKIFLDVSDCSRKTEKEIEEMLNLILIFSRYCQVILSLNRNEFETLYSSTWKQIPTDFETAGKAICKKSGVSILVIHEMDGSTAITDQEICSVKNRYIERPLFSTGGGDNFNAGLVYGLLKGLDIKEAMIVANAASGYYITKGKSPKVHEILEYIENWKKEM